MPNGTIIWDANEERVFEMGVNHGVLYTKDTGNRWTGVAWNGLSSVSESPEGGDPNPIYADNIKYLNLVGVEEFKGTIEAYTYPEEFAECDGSVIVGGVTVGQQRRKPFCLSYRTQVGDGDDMEKGYKLHLVYDCIASPSERQYETINDSPEAITFSWEFTSTPREVSGYKPVSILTIDSTKADATKLQSLEDILYGTDTDDARMPTPKEVLDIFA